MTASSGGRRLLVFALAFVVALWLGTGAASALDVTVTSSPYNARGDGVTNDRAAIQSAIDAVNSAGGGTVTVPGTATYLTGNLILKSNVNLNIAAGATIRQSQDPSHYANRPERGREIPGGRQFQTYLDQNYPLIYAGRATNVAITGAGIVQMTYNGSDPNSVILHAIGTNLVSGFRISGITIDFASAYNIAIRNSDNGEISGVTTTNPNTLNSDGISLMNSSFVRVHGNDLTTKDDGIYVWASYDDPRRSAWWDSDTPRPSHDIEVYDNVVDNLATNGSHGFLFINWTNSAPDASRVEISRIDVHDNWFSATYPIGVLENDVYHGGGSKTPSKWLRFARNTLISNVRGILARDLSTMATTDLSIDDPVYDFGRATNATGLYNANFDALAAWPAQFGTSFWSTEGGGTASNAVVGQPGGWFGEIARFDGGYASITQGVHLATGTYEFGVAAQSSGANIRLIAVDGTTTPGSVVAQTTFANTTWQARSITFDVRTAGNYRLGIDSAGAGSSSTAYGRIDSATLTKIR